MKPIHTLFVLLISMLPIMVQGAIYKTVDKDGNVVFTDMKPDNRYSEEVKLKPITPMEASPPVKTFPVTTREPKPSKEPYAALKIVEPASDSTVRNGGNFSVRIQINPQLAQDHRIRLLMNGELADKPRRALNFTLLNVDRGAYNLQVEVIDRKGTVVQSASSQVYVQRTVYKPSS